MSVVKSYEQEHIGWCEVAFFILELFTVGYIMMIRCEWGGSIGT